jgi:hypothetical protein
MVAARLFEVDSVFFRRSIRRRSDAQRGITGDWMPRGDNSHAEWNYSKKMR